MQFLLLDYNYFWLFLAVISGAMLFVPLIRGNPDAVSPQQAVLLVNRENAVIVDVREQTEFAAGHLPAARNIPLKEIEARSSELKKFIKRPLIVVCQSGNRSRNALGALRKAGFERVVNLDGGFAAWLQAGQPVSRT